MPLGQAAVVPDGATTVVCEGGAGSLLLKLKHPPSRSGNSRGNRRMDASSAADCWSQRLIPCPVASFSSTNRGNGHSEAFLTLDRRLSSFSERMCQGPPPVPTRSISPQWNVRGSRMRYASLSVFRPFIAGEPARERDQLMRHIVLTIAMLAAAPAALAQNYPLSQTYSAPPASDTDTGASGPAMRGQSQSGSSHSGVPTAQNSQENCGTPDEFKACPPLPRHPLPYYPANRHD